MEHCKGGHMVQSLIFVMSHATWHEKIALRPYLYATSPEGGKRCRLHENMSCTLYWLQPISQKMLQVAHVIQING